MLSIPTPEELALLRALYGQETTVDDPGQTIPPAPYCVRRDQARFKPRSWEKYTWEELYWWVKLLCKRAGHRDFPEGADRDLADAHDYRDMAAQKLANLTQKAKPTFDDLLEAETGEVHVACMTSLIEHTMTTMNRVSRGWENKP